MLLLRPREGKGADTAGLPAVGFGLWISDLGLDSYGLRPELRPRTSDFDIETYFNQKNPSSSTWDLEPKGQGLHSEV